MVMACVSGLTPTFAVKVRLSELNCMVGGAMLMVMGTVTGLPTTALPVIGSMALIVALVVYVVPPCKPLASTITSMLVPVPPTRPVPDVADSETKDGALGSSAAVQFNGSPPALLIAICWSLDPVLTLNVSAPGPAFSTGAAITLVVIPTCCGLPSVVIPLLSTAASETVPLYVPAESEADVTVTVNVALLPLVTCAADGVTASQFPPSPVVTVGVIVTLPLHVPLTAMLNVWVVGFKPTSVE